MNVGSGLSTHSQCLEAGVPGHLSKDLGRLVTIAFSLSERGLGTAFFEDVRFM